MTLDRKPALPSPAERAELCVGLYMRHVPQLKAKNWSVTQTRGPKNSTRAYPTNSNKCRCVSPVFRGGAVRYRTRVDLPARSLLTLPWHSKPPRVFHEGLFRGEKAGTFTEYIQTVHSSNAEAVVPFSGAALGNLLPGRPRQCRGTPTHSSSSSNSKTARRQTSSTGASPSR